MLRWIGCITIVAAGSGLGFYYSARLCRRERLLRGLYRMVNLLKGEISYGNQPLPEAFRQMQGRTSPLLGEFAKGLAEALSQGSGRPFAEIFAGEVERTLKNSGLEREDFEELEHMGRHLGYLDRQMQLRVLDLYGHRLLETLQLLQSELPEQKKLCKSLGVMGGLFLAILLA